jgi:hypothetical protein
MSQLTIRGFDKDIEREIQKIAKSEKVSRNKAVLRILQQGVKSTNRPSAGGVIGNSLDHLSGKWSDEEVLAMDETEKDFEHIESELWS